MLTHAGVVVQVNLDVATDNPAECPHEVIHLPRVCAPNCIGDADTVDADLVDSLVYGEEVYEVGAEAILGGEADFNALGLDELDDLDSRLGNISHILSMRKLAQEGRSAYYDVDAVHPFRQGQQKTGA